jgi:hypothetical protein
MEHGGVRRDAGACPGELILRLVQGQCSPRGERSAGYQKKGHYRFIGAASNDSKALFDGAQRTGTGTGYR